MSPTFTPTLAPTDVPSTFVASFVITNLIETYSINATTARALAETVADVLHLTSDANVHAIDAPTIASNLRGRNLLSQSMTAYIEATVSSGAFPGYARDSSALYLELHSILADAIKDGSFNLYFQARLSCCGRFPVALVNLLAPVATSTSIGGPVEPLYFPTISPTSFGAGEASTKEKEANGVRDLAVVSVVVIFSSLIICCALALFFRQALHSGTSFQIQGLQSQSERGPQKQLTVYQKQENRISVRMPPSAGEIDANEVYLESIRKYEEYEQEESDRQFKEYQMVLARQRGEHTPMISNGDAADKSNSSFLEKGYNFISRSFSRSQDPMTPVKSPRMESMESPESLKESVGRSGSSDSNSSASSASPASVATISISAESISAESSPVRSTGELASMSAEQLASMSADSDNTAPSNAELITGTQSNDSAL